MAPGFGRHQVLTMGLKTQFARVGTDQHQCRPFPRVLVVCAFLFSFGVFHQFLHVFIRQLFWFVSKFFFFVFAD